MERVASVLDPENAHQETIHPKHYYSPENNSYLLLLRVHNPRNLKCKRYGCECQYAICDSGQF